MTEITKAGIARPNFKKYWPYIWHFSQMGCAVAAVIVLMRSH